MLCGKPNIIALCQGEKMLSTGSAWHHHSMQPEATSKQQHLQLYNCKAPEGTVKQLHKHFHRPGHHHLLQKLHWTLPFVFQRKQTHYKWHWLSPLLHGIVPNPSAQQQNRCSSRRHVHSHGIKYSNKMKVRANIWLFINHRHYKLHPLNKSSIRLCRR